ncbi:hypothetical protein AB1Y20_017352 [Prymnesium parvum]|uniref:Glycosyltransferase 61 catalytic domain-containing protein n=1 Tax=Prymnesium parvum TaxID=97485 RepID=A0AB34JJY6_PRYPA
MATGCPGCSALLDLRCNYSNFGTPSNPNPIPYFHSIVDCLLPLHLNLRHAAQPAACALVEDLSLSTLVSALFPSIRRLSSSQLRHTPQCLDAMLPQQRERAPSPDGWRGLLTTLRSTGSLPLPPPAASTGPDFSGPIILIERQNSRRFLGSTASRLHSDLQKRTRRDVRVFSGEESARETVRLFANAAGIVGYHGAGFANAVFTQRRACVLELSPAFGREAWRTNGLAMMRWTPVLAWDILMLPLTQLLRANGQNVELAKVLVDGSSRIQSLRRRGKALLEHLNVELTEDQSIVAAATISSCISSFVMASTDKVPTSVAARPSEGVDWYNSSIRVFGQRQAIEEDQRALAAGPSASPASTSRSTPAPVASDYVSQGQPMEIHPSASVTARQRPSPARPVLLPAVPQPLLLLVSWIYGATQWKSTCIPLFLRSVGASPTIRIVILGDPGPPAHLLPLPPNVKFVSLPWGALWERLQTVLNATMPHLASYDHRKVTDVKPLAALLMPEVVTPYAWWGWVDNDVMLSGHMLAALTQQLGELHSVGAVQVRDNPMQLSYGPLSIYSTAGFFSQVVPVLDVDVLRAVFSRLRRHRANYDEWGQFFAGMGFRFSFSAAVLDAAAATGSSFGVAKLVAPAQLDDAGAPPDCNLRIDRDGVSHLHDGKSALLVCHFHHRKGKAPLDRMASERVLSSPCIGVRANSSGFGCHAAPPELAGEGDVAENTSSLFLSTMPRQCFVALKENEVLLGPGTRFNWHALEHARAVRSSCGGLSNQ